jgi:hypothetical protein
MGIYTWSSAKGLFVLQHVSYVFARACLDFLESGIEASSTKAEFYLGFLEERANFERDV